MRAAGLEGILKVPDANAFWSLTTSLPSLPTLSCWSPAFGGVFRHARPPIPAKGGVDTHVERAHQAGILARLHDDDDRQMARAFERAHVAAQSQAVGRGQVQADDDEIVGFVGGRRADQELYVAQAWRPQQGGCRCRLSRSSPLP
jgi:hypothetical protein